MPQMQMNVMRTSQQAATMAWYPRSFAVVEEIQLRSLANWRVYAPATSGAEMQKMTLVATCTHPLNHPR